LSVRPVSWRRLLGPLSICFFVMALVAMTLRAQEAPPAQETPVPQETPVVTEAAANGTIQGSVKDADGSPVEGARVLFRSKVEGISSVVRTGKDGRTRPRRLLRATILFGLAFTTSRMPKPILR
jgi:hypothetical protein